MDVTPMLKSSYNFWEVAMNDNSDVQIAKHKNMNWNKLNWNNKLGIGSLCMCLY